MYKVILVDDERLDLEGLKQLVPWEDLDMQVLAAVHSGFTALSHMDEQVDILVTDIKMPIMSGLELAEKVKAAFPRVKIIFVSGYQDFQYARKAIAMHAAGYVLKPIDDNELLGVLRETARQLKREAEQSTFETRYREAVPLVLGDKLLQWLLGRMDTETASALWEEAGKPLPMAGAVAVIEIDDLLLRRKSCTDLDALVGELIERITENIGREEEPIVCEAPNSRLVWVMASKDPERLLQKLIDEIRQTTVFTITVGLGPRVEGTRRLPESYHMAGARNQNVRRQKSHPACRDDCEGIQQGCQ